MPDVCASSMRSVMGACGVAAHSGNQRVSGSSRSILPCCTESSASVETNNFVIDAKSNGVSTYTGRLRSSLRVTPYADSKTSVPRCSMRATAPVNCAPHASRRTRCTRWKDRSTASMLRRNGRLEWKRTVRGRTAEENVGEPFHAGPVVAVRAQYVAGAIEHERVERFAGADQHRIRKRIEQRFNGGGLRRVHVRAAHEHDRPLLASTHVRNDGTHLRAVRLERKAQFGRLFAARERSVLGVHALHAVYRGAL